MARGKKTTPEVIYEIMASWAATDSYAETARALGLPATTVEKIVKAHKDEPEYVELCAEKRKDFSTSALRIIEKAMKRLEESIENKDKEIPVNHLTTVIGTLYDKRALADGNATERVSVDIKLPDEADEYAG